MQLFMFKAYGSHGYHYNIRVQRISVPPILMTPFNLQLDAVSSDFLWKKRWKLRVEAWRQVDLII
jgi:hypothetical protein